MICSHNAAYKIPAAPLRSISLLNPSQNPSCRPHIADFGAVPQWDRHLQQEHYIQQAESVLVLSICVSRFHESLKDEENIFMFANTPHRGKKGESLSLSHLQVYEAGAGCVPLMRVCYLLLWNVSAVNDGGWTGGMKCRLHTQPWKRQPADWC